ncbi:DUF2971 domain-containing protein [Bradyrhizobium guangzhouense]|uniref:DUF2971 domain-containing protein n=1 Tax=Bradyrhizobium guangzhouense TaxID=1325095 RepID=A0ABY0E4W6_9BRAD|nr:DUF2971 domain-containing protein [Bradyrhizobium guangzhouense]RXH12343.1 DUF2971 domain-containing protein [Bradyrhizobium guangzhouense]
MAGKIFPDNRVSLFHYTSGDGLVGIVKTNCLFASHSDFLNDSTECRIIRDLLTPVIETEIDATTRMLVQRGLLKKEVFEAHNGAFAIGEANNVLNVLFKAINGLAPFFITSFCMHAKGTVDFDNGLLSQWRGYGRSGGFAIEFNESGINELVSLELNKYAYDSIETRRVAYKDYGDKFDPAEFKGLANAMIREVFASQGFDISPLVGEPVVETYIRPFLKSAPFMKHFGFREENEYRIVAPCYRTSVKKIATPEELAIGNFNFKSMELRRRADGTMIPYIELFRDLERPLPIMSILVGPHANQAHQRNALEVFLEQRGLDIPVRVSNLPYREW